VLALTQASNVLGTINPIKTVLAEARAKGVITVVDGAQSVPHFRVDVRDLGCDFLAFSGHKLFGPTGLGALYGRYDILDTLPPWQGGGEMIEQVSFERTTYNVLPYRFEAGTPAIAEAVGLHAALRFYTALDRVRLHAHEQALLQQATELSATVPGMRIVGQAAHKVPVLSFLIEGLHPSDIGTLLDQQGIGIRTGHHCAMPLMQKLNIPGTARASFAFYNSADEVSQLFDALRKVQRMLV
jgi:cysteine desulfurase/selenocysteine lyase